MSNFIIFLISLAYCEWLGYTWGNKTDSRGFAYFHLPDSTSGEILFMSCHYLENGYNIQFQRDKSGLTFTITNIDTNKTEVLQVSEQEGLLDSMIMGTTYSYGLFSEDNKRYLSDFPASINSDALVRLKTNAPEGENGLFRAISYMYHQSFDNHQYYRDLARKNFPKHVEVMTGGTFNYNPDKGLVKYIFLIEKALGIHITVFKNVVTARRQRLNPGRPAIYLFYDTDAEKYELLIPELLFISLPIHRRREASKYSYLLKLPGFRFVRNILGTKENPFRPIWYGFSDGARDHDLEVSDHIHMINTDLLIGWFDDLQAIANMLYFPDKVDKGQYFGLEDDPRKMDT